MERTDRVRGLLRERKLDGLLSLCPVNTAYLARLFAVTYSRPIAVLVAEQDALVVPELEREHAEQASTIRDIRPYADAGFGAGEGQSPLAVALAAASDALSELGWNRLSFRLAFEANHLTCDGFSVLSSLLGCQLVPTRGLVEGLRLIKDGDEISRVRMACELADLGMAVEVNASRPGASEMEIAAEGDRAMTMEAARKSPGCPVGVCSRPIAGLRTALPHAMSGQYRLAPGDVILHGTGVQVGGYCCEVERTMFSGEPTAEQRRAFAAMLAAQTAGIESVRPGAAACDIDRTCRDTIVRLGYGDCLLHRSGHGMGLESHEAPHLALSDDTVLAEGMIVAVEPGIYIPGVGGFRHSDTVLVTGDGAMPLTRFPRAIDDLIR